MNLLFFLIVGHPVKFYSLHPTASWQILCMYKALLSDKTDLIFSYFDPTDVSVLTPLSLDRFYGFYQVAKLKWIKVNNQSLLITCQREIFLSIYCPPSGPWTKASLL